MFFFLLDFAWLDCEFYLGDFDIVGDHGLDCEMCISSMLYVGRRWSRWLTFCVGVRGFAIYCFKLVDWRVSGCDVVWMLIGVVGRRHFCL